MEEKWLKLYNIVSKSKMGILELKYELNEFYVFSMNLLNFWIFYVKKE